MTWTLQNTNFHFLFLSTARAAIQICLTSTSFARFTSKLACTPYKTHTSTTKPPTCLLQWTEGSGKMHTLLHQIVHEFGPSQTLQNAFPRHRFDGETSMQQRNLPGRCVLYWFYVLVHVYIWYRRDVVIKCGGLWKQAGCIKLWNRYNERRKLWGGVKLRKILGVILRFAVQLLSFILSGAQGFYLHYCVKKQQCSSYTLMNIKSCCCLNVHILSTS